jgi:hypothetical protein
MGLIQGKRKRILVTHLEILVAGIAGFGFASLTHRAAEPPKNLIAITNDYAAPLVPDTKKEYKLSENVKFYCTKIIIAYHLN